MPTVFREGPYRFFFYASDRGEPPHVHVERDRHTAEVRLNPVRLQHSSGLEPSEIRRIMRTVTENETSPLEAWHEYFHT